MQRGFCHGLLPQATLDGHLRPMIIDRAAAKGREIDVDTEVARTTGEVTDHDEA